jgi:hypothetical protein
MAAATRIAFFTTVRQVPALAAISSIVRRAQAPCPALSPHRRRSAAQPARRPQDHSQRGAKVYALHAPTRQPHPA